jgi:hypothetical protein
MMDHDNLLQAIRDLLDQIEDEFPESMSLSQVYEMGEIHDHLRQRRKTRASKVSHNDPHVIPSPFPRELPPDSCRLRSRRWSSRWWTKSTRR